jgi:hypothetical protein
MGREMYFDKRCSDIYIVFPLNCTIFKCHHNAPKRHSSLNWSLPGRNSVRLSDITSRSLPFRKLDTPVVLRTRTEDAFSNLVFLYINHLLSVCVCDYSRL